MCVKTHLKHVFSPTEQLKYWLIGLPIILLIIHMLVFTAHDFAKLFAETEQQALLSEVKQ